MRPEDLFNMFDMGAGAGFAFGDDKIPYPLSPFPVLPPAIMPAHAVHACCST